MKTRKYIFSILAVMLVLASCSTKKNTSLTRFWHSFTARYNIYYNGAQAYIDGSLEKEKGNKDNYTERIPLYTVSNKGSRELGKGHYETAITKAEKAIQLHSIKAKPEWNKERRKTEQDIEWLSRKEYNPFLWRAWMLMGRSQFYKGSFDEAAATFSYMSRLYKGQPSIYGKARAWLAKCYIENDWIYDAEDVIRNMMRDSIDWRAQKEWDYTLCDYYLHTDNLPEATKYLRRVISHEMRRKQKAREYFLLGQLEAAQGHKKEAYEAFRKVTRQNPPYELDFNARISMTEVMAEGQSKKMISRLRRMAHNDNNKDYLDQVYYAIGNIYLAEKDTANAIAAYEKGNEKATRSGIEKGVLLLHLGDLYWQLEKYGDAKRCYGVAIGLLDKERPDYEELSHRSKVLDELVPFTDAIALQDSLLELAEMPEAERLAAIDRVIKALKDKEKEEEAKLTEEQLAQRQQQYGDKNMQQKNNTPIKPAVASNEGGAWYFYNLQAVTQGKQTFMRQWGRRENVDDWQRNNRTVVGQPANEEVDEAELTDEQRDSLSALGELEKKEGIENLDSVPQDPHTREYYLAQIPFSDEQKAACHDIIKEGLLKSAVIFKDKLDNLRLSEKQFTRLRSQYSDYEPKDEVYYHLFLLHSRKGDHDVAATFVDSLKQYCPESKYTILLTDPYFAENAKFGKHIEDSLYGATYEAFKEDRFQEVYANASISEQRFPLGDNRDRFIFFYGMTKLNDGNADECVASMQKIVDEYPQSSVSEMAGMIINGVRAGKKLHGAKFDLSNVWDRRGMELSETAVDSTKIFTKERNTDFLFMMAYAPDSINENQLLFQMARYNFTSFMVRNFDIDIENSYGMHHMIVSGFRNFDEARQYSRLLLQQEGIRKTMGKARPIVISEENLALIGTRYSYNDYDTFYVKHFAPLPMERPEGLYDAVTVKTEPTVTTQQRGDDYDEEGAVRRDDDPVKPNLPTEEVAPGGAKPTEPEEQKQTDEHDDNAIEIPVGTEVVKQQEESFDVPADESSTPKAPQNDSFDVPVDEPSTPKAAQNDSFDVPVDEPLAPKAAQNDSFDVPADEPSTPKAPQNDSFDVPVDEPSAPKAPQNDSFDVPADEPSTPKAPQNDAFDVPVDEPSAPKTSSEESFDVPVDESTAPKAADDNSFDVQADEPVQKKQEDEVVFTIDEKDNASQRNESAETFDFSDDEDDKPANEADEEIELIDEKGDGKQSSRDLEDEYYELDGF